MRYNLWNNLSRTCQATIISATFRISTVLLQKKIRMKSNISTLKWSLTWKTVIWWSNNCTWWEMRIWFTTRRTGRATSSFISIASRSCHSPLLAFSALIGKLWWLCRKALTFMRPGPSRCSNKSHHHHTEPMIRPSFWSLIWTNSSILMAYSWPALEKKTLTMGYHSWRLFRNRKRTLIQCAPKSTILTMSSQRHPIRARILGVEEVSQSRWARRKYRPRKIQHRKQRVWTRISTAASSLTLIRSQRSTSAGRRQLLRRRSKMKSPSPLPVLQR